MLVVDINTLLFVHTLHFFEQVLINALYSVEPEYVVRVERSAGYLSAGIYLIPFFDV